MPVPNMTQAPSKEVNDQLSRLNRSKRYELTKYQRRQIDEAEPVYIYNVSPIHQWERFQGQLGTITIRKREEGQQISLPTIIPGAVARWFDKGLGRKEVFIEDGMEIAEDICQCSVEYPPPSLNNNLNTYGVFITKKPFEDLPQKEQTRLLDAANDALVLKLRNIILEADQFHSGTKTKDFVGKIHRDSLAAFNELTGSNEERPWAPIRNSARKAASVDCPFCGVANKPHIALCANCKQIIDHDLYESLQKKVKK